MYIESSNHNFVHSDNDTVDNLIEPCNSIVNNISDSIEPKSSIINVSKEVKHLSCNNLSSLVTVEDEFMLNVVHLILMMKVKPSRQNICLMILFYRCWAIGRFHII